MAIENPFSKLSKPQLYAVVIGGVGVTGYALYSHHKSTGSWSPFASGTASSVSSASSGPSATGTVTDPTTGQVYSDTAVDPVTQMTYASEISDYGSVAAAESEYAGTYGTSSNSVAAQQYDTGYASATTTAGTTTTSGTDQYTSNSAWSQAVQAGLEDISGSTSYDGTDIGTALGAYFQGTPLTAAQNQLINTAIAEYGNPPQGAPPVTLVPASTTGTTGTTTGTTGTTTVSSGGGGTGQTTTSATQVIVPNFVGMDAVTAQQTATRNGLKSTLSGPAFTAGKGTRLISFQNPKAGTTTAKGSNVVLGYKLVTGGTATELSGGKVVQG